MNPRVTQHTYTKERRVLQGGRKAPFPIDNEDHICVDTPQTKTDPLDSSATTWRKPSGSTSPPDPLEEAEDYDLVDQAEDLAHQVQPEHARHIRRASPHMPCNYPATGRKAPDGTMTYYGHLQKAAGKIPPLPPNYKDVPLPCGKCTGCKLERSRQWAVRLMHEAQLHTKTSFVTLTYNDNHLPTPGAASSQSLTAAPVGRPGSKRASVIRAHAKTHAHEILRHASLAKADLNAFTRALNEDARRRFGKGVKYYACGEYGEQTNRPHYHIAIYGEDFSDDRYYWKQSTSKNPLWRSSRLARLWPHGDADIGELTFESAAYIARYIMKKITGSIAWDHYKRTNEEGNEYWLVPEFNVMSRRPGLAKEWFMKNKYDVYPHDHVISRGNPAKPPRYYDKLLEALAPYEHAQIKEKRENEPRNPADQTPARLDARETVTLAKLSQHKRSLE